MSAVAGSELGPDRLEEIRSTGLFGNFGRKPIRTLEDRLEVSQAQWKILGADWEFWKRNP
ncbi:hypothetical protein ACQ4M3_05065 [Leptolyngbya sp. AN03gr2]|uniref:hypothetical protein n=1 Tax=unclassified Leptolyngbya TaxID=2650499 RepID=UPI003D312C55